MSNENKPATLEELHQAYSQYVATYGDLKYRAQILNDDADALIPKMKELNQAAYKLKLTAQKEEKAPEAAVPTASESSPVVPS